MSLTRAVILFLTLGAAVSAAGCGEPPDREMQQALGAIDAARAAGAEEYATEEFRAAQQALERANEAVGLRDYRLALNHALDSRERAQNSAKLAAEGRAAARVEADHALTALAGALAGAQTLLKNAEAARAPARTLAEPRRTLASTERRLQEARTAFEQGAYHEVVSIEAKEREALAAATRTLETATKGRRR
jgi:hypothetical protein